MSTFVEALGEKAAERWSAALFTPAILFWVGGLLAWMIDTGGWADSGQRIVEWFDALSGVEQVLAVIGALLVFTASDTVARQLTLPVLRLLEGYGLLVRVPWLADYQSWRLDRATKKLEPLWAKQKESSLSPDELDRFSTLAEFVRRFPESTAFLMPTRLGNVLRAGETWPRDKYGLDAIICWPRTGSGALRRIYRHRPRTTPTRQGKGFTTSSWLASLCARHSRRVTRCSEHDARLLGCASAHRERQ